MHLAQLYIDAWLRNLITSLLLSTYIGCVRKCFCAFPRTDKPWQADSTGLHLSCCGGALWSKIWRPRAQHPRRWRGKDTQRSGSRYHIVAQTLHHNPRERGINPSERSLATATIIISGVVITTGIVVTSGSLTISTTIQFGRCEWWRWHPSPITGKAAGHKVGAKEVPSTSFQGYATTKGETTRKERKNRPSLLKGR